MGVGSEIMRNLTRKVNLVNSEANIDELLN
jgi:hypothetical protein